MYCSIVVTDNGYASRSHVQWRNVVSGDQKFDHRILHSLCWVVFPKDQNKKWDVTDLNNMKIDTTQVDYHVRSAALLANSRIW